METQMVHSMTQLDKTQN